MYNHCMVDLETLDTTPTAVILTIGAVLFNPKDKDNYDTILNDETRIFHGILEFQEQLDKGRTVSASTITWWMEQNKLAQKTAFTKNRTPVPEALKTFYKFVADSKDVTYLWGNGSSFDNVILESLFRDYNWDFPFDFYNYRDLRTAKDMSSYALNIPRGIKHDALQDAVYQVLKLQGYYTK